MINFLDGPANGQRLMLRRAPIFLRVELKNGKWDALDQISDEPQQGALLYVYRLASEVGTCHMNFGRGKGGWYSIADYRYYGDDRQPPETVMQDLSQWHTWCVEAHKKDPAGQNPTESWGLEG